MKEYRYQEELTQELFKNPTSEYRGAPFWAWNGDLNLEQMKMQIDSFEQMGFGGFHIHARTGLTAPYLGNEYMDRVRECTEYAKEKGMLSWLYDEDRCPSGYAGGLVTEDKNYRAHYLVVSPRTQKESLESGRLQMMDTHASRSAEGKLLTAYDIVLKDNGMLQSYRRIAEDEKAIGRKWYAYLESPAENPWYNYETYADTLSKEAMDRFIEITYDRYKLVVGDYFDTVIPSMFTDEPQHCHKTYLRFPEDDIDVFFPWTEDLTDTYEKAYQEDLLEHLPLLIWETEDEMGKRIRYHFHDHVTERFVEAFADNCGNWCNENNMILTGHMMGESNLHSQTESTGESMRSYRSFGMPGVDILCDDYEYTVVKQAQSASRQNGCPGVLSELYGVTNWDYDFRGHKRQGDWQAAMGVTVRVPHLSWLTMQGESKRDYPASIHYQSPWAEKYHLVEEHFARVNTAMTRGTAMVNIGVIHPIESYWLHWGPTSQNGDIREQMEEHFRNLTRWLLLDAQDFDFVCESTLPQQCECGSAPLAVGRMRYSTIILPQCVTIRRTTLERLLQFVEEGGKLLVLGKLPEYVDGVSSTEPQKLKAYIQEIPFERIALCRALEAEQLVDFREENGNRTGNLIYQMREEEGCKWLFIAQGIKPKDVDVAVKQSVTIEIKGNYVVEQYQTLEGKNTKLEPIRRAGKTILAWDFYQHDSLLLKLLPITKEVRTDGEEVRTGTQKAVVEEVWKQIKTEKKADIQLLAPNVLLMDMAEYALDFEEYQEEEEVLRADNLLRLRLGWDPRKDEMAEPWAQQVERPEHIMRLRFTFHSEVLLAGVKLALENAQVTKIFLDGKPVIEEPDGWFTDRSIHTVPLQEIDPGTHRLELHFPFGKREAAEWCYLLGDFSVELDGCETVLKKPVRNVGFGSLTDKGLPFYGDNVIYRMEILTQGGNLKIHVPQYRGAMITVLLDGSESGNIIYAPYDCILEDVAAGKHVLELKLYGTRFNSFGQLHLCNPNFTWYGPDSYRTTGDDWSFEYRPKPFGILTSPVIEEQL